MDVTCERCNTEYEFDDALVSERGTTVKCTSCGHQFRIRRSEGGGAPERWVVRTVDGRELEFTALRELQAAITHRIVTRDDVLSRDGGRPRRLGSIPELEPFFTTASSSVSMPAPGFGREPPGAARPHMPTPTGLGAMSPSSRTDGSVAIPLPIAMDRGGVVYGNAVDVSARTALAERPSAVAQTLGSQPSPFRATPSAQPPPMAPPPPAPQEPPRTTSATIRAMAPVGPGSELSGLAQPPLPPPPRTPSLPPVEPRPPSEPPRTLMMEPPRAAVTPPPPPLDRRGRSEPPQTVAPMTMPMSSGPASPAALRSPGSSGTMRSFPPLTPTPGEVRLTLDDATSGDFRFSAATSSKRQGSARLIVGMVVGGLLLFAAFAVGRQFVGQAPEAPVAAAPAADPRADSLRKEAETAFAKGDLEGARDALVRASALADKDPEVAVGLARVAAAKADFLWLRVALRKSDDPERDALGHELAGLAERALAAADDAAKLAPDDGGVVLARIHALLLLGRRDEARKLVPTLRGSTNAEESALVRAMLDLAEESPDWTTVNERLRTALGPEQGLGRARALLVYALARAGNVVDARAELARLRGDKPHPLESPLRAYVERRAEEVSKQDLAAAASTAAVAQAATPRAVAEPAAPAAAPEPTPEAPSGLPEGVHIDTTDLPGVAPSPAATATAAPVATEAPATPTATPTAAPKAPPPDAPSPIDTSDLPGVAPTP